MTDVNAAMGIEDELLEQQLQQAPNTTRKGGKPAAKAAAVKKEIDPEDDRENWPVIFIDTEEGKPNFAFLHTAGTKKDGSPFDHQLKVQRGVSVPVPPSAVNMLRTCIESRYVQPDLTQPKVRVDRASIPWRLEEKGKYIK